MKKDFRCYLNNDNVINPLVTMIKDIILIKVFVLLQFSNDFIPNIVKIIDPKNMKTGLVPIIAWTTETGPEVIAIIINILARAAPSSVETINGPFFILVR